MINRQRLSATVEGELLAAGRTAVAQGEAANLSAWVNGALRRQAEHDQRTRALDAFLAAYEAEQGEITEEEMREAGRRARQRGIVISPPKSTRTTAVVRRKRGVA